MLAFGVFVSLLNLRSTCATRSARWLARVASARLSSDASSRSRISYPLMEVIGIDLRPRSVMRLTWGTLCAR